MRRWINFSIRDLFWLAIVVGLVIGWRMNYEMMLGAVAEINKTQRNAATMSKNEQFRIEATMLVQQLQAENDDLRAQIAKLTTATMPPIGLP